MKQRIITGIVGGAAFLLLVWLGGVPYTILIGLLALIAYYELIKMNKATIFSIESAVGYLSLLLIILINNYHIQLLENIELSMIPVSAMIAYLFITVLKKNHVNFDKMGYFLLGSIYIGYGFSYMLTTRLAEQGLTLTLFVLFATWASDSGAYFVGMLIGKHKLWPDISPKKTIEGSLGGIVFAILISVLLHFYINIYQNITHAILAGLFISIAGQIGDLVESALKRSKGVKDSGNILPGHGGILDRFDSLIFTFPILYLLHIL